MKDEMPPASITLFNRNISAASWQRSTKSHIWSSRGNNAFHAPGTCMMPGAYGSFCAEYVFVSVRM